MGASKNGLNEKLWNTPQLIGFFGLTTKKEAEPTMVLLSKP